MTTQTEALTLALEAMNECRFDDRWYAAKEAIKEALAQPEQEQHKQYPVNSLPNEKTTDKWESARVSDYNSGWNDCRKTMFISDTKPVLEIVNGQIDRSWDAIPANFTGLLYTTPPQRTWVGLTDEDLAVCGDEDDVMLARYWERVCKEKNT